MKNLIKLFAAASIIFVSNIFYAQPTQEWFQFYDQPDIRNKLYASVTDTEGNSYLTGSSQELLDDNLTSKNFLTLKYDKNGNLLWAKTFDSGSAGNDESFAIALDKNGNVYAAGYETSGGIELEEFYIIKYSPAGDEIWHTNFNGPESGGITGNDHADRIFVDDNENVFVVGTVQAFDNSSYYLHTNIGVVKFGSDGALEYSNIYDTPNHGDEVPTGISVNKFGQVFVAGYTTPQNGEIGGMILLMFDSSLNLRWEAQFNDASDEDDKALLLTTDKYGNAYICGYKKKVNNADSDIFIAKYDTAGAAVWTDAINSSVEGVNPNFHQPEGMAIDNNDNLYIHAYNSGFKNLLTKYDLNGNRKWINFWYGGDNVAQGEDQVDFYKDYNHCIVFDGDNNIYLMGYKTSPDSMYIGALGAAKFDPNGNEIFEAFMYDDFMADNDNWSNEPMGIGLDEGNSIYLTGTFYTGNSLDHAFEIVKFSQIVDVEKDGGSRPVHFSLEQNYPNPFNPSTIISFTLDEREHVELAVYNSLGQLVAELVNEEKSAGNYQVNFNASNLSSGIYYYRLFAGNKIITKKCALLK